VDRPAREEKYGVTPFERRPVCRGGRPRAEETVRRFAEIRRKLERQETEEFQPLGRSFQVA
jgi:hypothetical protein